MTEFETIKEELLESPINIFINEGTNLQQLITSDNQTWFTYKDLEHLRSELHILTLDDFFVTFQSILQNVQEREGIKSEYYITASEEYPPDQFEGSEAICWRLLHRGPANMNAKGTGRPQARYRTLDVLEVASLPDRAILLRQRPIEVIIEFSCWAKSNKIANKRALWLEKTLISHTYAFLAIGAQDFRFKERTADTYMTISGQKFFYRNLQFKLRYLEYDIISHQKFRNFDLNMFIET